MNLEKQVDDSKSIFSQSANWLFFDRNEHKITSICLKHGESFHLEGVRIKDP